ncbi:MAG: DEAD/DEAH box helicase [Kiritimatiellia bacterium]
MVDFFKKTKDGQVEKLAEAAPVEHVLPPQMNTKREERLDRGSRPRRKQPEAQHHNAPAPKSDTPQMHADVQVDIPQTGELPRRRRRPRRRKRPEGSVAAPAPVRREEASLPADQTVPPVQHVETPWDVSVYDVPPQEGKMRFHDLDLPQELMHALHDLNFQYCTPIQQQILPQTLAGKDVSGRAPTGTGKTAAFLLSVFTRMLRKPITEPRRLGTPRCLVIAPTRELVLQIQRDAEALGKYTGLRSVAVYGGDSSRGQLVQLEKGPVDILAATPGRLLDFKNQHKIHLTHVETMVIDEADRMLDMGFIPDVRKIINSTPPRHERMTMLFSATLTPEVLRLSAQWTRDAVTIEVEPDQVAVDTVNQIVYIVRSSEKFNLLYNILKTDNPQRVIVFTNRRDEAQRLSDRLNRKHFPCALLSGALAQNVRTRMLNEFKEGKYRILVATDVAGRGLHIEDVSHVINYCIPREAEAYVHRIGRTGRAGKSGISISFADEEDSFYIPEIEKYMGRPLPCTYPDERYLADPDKKG